MPKEEHPAVTLHKRLLEEQVRLDLVAEMTRFVEQQIPYLVTKIAGKVEEIARFRHSLPANWDWLVATYGRAVAEPGYPKRIDVTPAPDIEVAAVAIGLMHAGRQVVISYERPEGRVFVRLDPA